MYMEHRDKIEEGSIQGNTQSQSQSVITVKYLSKIIVELFVVSMIISFDSHSIYSTLTWTHYRPHSVNQTHFQSNDKLLSATFLLLN